MSGNVLEWPEGQNLQPLVMSLYGKVSPRKLRLFAVACCRRVAHLLPDEACRRAIEVAERYADRRATRAELADVHAEAEAVARAIAGGFFFPESRPAAARCASQAVAWTTHPTKRHFADNAVDLAAAAVAYAAGPADNDGRYRPAHAAECAAQLRLLRDIVGGSLTPPPLAPDWLAHGGGLAARLAAAIYEERAFDRLPVLADALEDAGCDDEEMLAHCRGGGEHVRGCRVLDAILGRE